ncbi:hypothetical protein CCMSSC00406_0003580 [Pleurotus cornucopiae]|uniref:Uncharacterized protein n=1 Tax=Pleurotus cornucopiae TaxID=5321 RepID=A0ACB7IL92_PLECO|nr:hypothetical protein CCMSSC00406_0003580 [Pleurotus cornucopiae]
MGLSISRRAHSPDSQELILISSTINDPPQYHTHTALVRGHGVGSAGLAFSSCVEVNVPPPAYHPDIRDSGENLPQVPSYSPPRRDPELDLERGNPSGEAGRAAGWPATRTKILKGLGAFGLVVSLLTIAVVVAKFVHEPDPPR